MWDLYFIFVVHNSLVYPFYSHLQILMSHESGYMAVSRISWLFSLYFLLIGYTNPMDIPDIEETPETLVESYKTTFSLSSLLVITCGA